jgi:hypothetical protein
MLNSLKMKKTILFIIFLGSIISCEKEDGFWNLKRENKRDLLSNKVQLSDLFNLDFNISNNKTNSFNIDLTYAKENDAINVEEIGVCYNKTGIPDINQNESHTLMISRWPSQNEVGVVNDLEMNNLYYVRAYAKLNNTSLDDNDIKKFVTVYTGQKIITTKYGCYDFISKESINYTNWISSGFRYSRGENVAGTGFYYDLRSSNNGINSLSKTFYNMPSNAILILKYYNKSSNALININGKLTVLNSQISNDSLPLPVGTVSISISAEIKEPLWQFFAINSICIDVP